jgi:Domain of unknown function (DUF4326)
MPKVYSRRSGSIPPGAVYVGRPSPWGNPFPMRSESERDAVCDKFEKYATERAARDPLWLAPLQGRDLVCWCAPRRCHAETLLRLANPSRSPSAAEWAALGLEAPF